MKLTHLYLVWGEYRKESLKPIYNDTINLVSSILYVGYCILIIRHTLVLYKCQIQYTSCLAIKSCEHTIITSPIGCIYMDEPMTRKRRLFLFNNNVA